jgi:hypothetical protein
MDAGAERQMSQDGQLLGRVAAVDVERRVGLGVAQPLGFLEPSAYGTPPRASC